MDFAALLKLVQENPIVAALLGSALGLVGGLAWRFVKKGDTVVIDKLMHTELLQKHPDLADAVFAINDFIMLGVSTAFSTVVAEAKADGSWNPKKGQEVKDKVIEKVEEQLGSKLEELTARLAKDVGGADAAQALIDAHMSQQVEEALKSLKKAIQAGADPKAAVVAAQANLAAASAPPTPPRVWTEAELKALADKANETALKSSQAGEASAAGAIAAGLLMLTFVGGFVMGCATAPLPKGCAVNGQLICCDPDTLQRALNANAPDGGR